MEFWKTILGLTRRKVVAIPVFALTLALAAAGWALLPERYVTSASMVLVTPSGGGSIDRTKPVAQTNPLLQFTDDLRTTASILILAMNTTDVFTSLGVTEDGPTDLTIDDGRSNPQLLGVGTTGPFIYMQVESDSPATASKVLGAAEERLKEELEDRQNELKAHPITFVQVEDVVRLPPESDLTAKLQGAVGGALLGLLAGLGTAYAVERRKLILTPEAPEAPEAPAALAAPAVALPEPARTAPGDGNDDADGQGNGRTPGDADGQGNGVTPPPALTDLDETGPIDVVRLNAR